MRRRALSGLLLTATLSLPASAEKWRELAQGDGYSSSRGTIHASATHQSPQKVLSVAKAFLGIPYVWAGTQPTSGFDCSGYAYEVMRLNGYEIPRMADEQFEKTARVKYKNLRPGDLVFFTTYLPGPSHVGFYLGGGKFIHASSAAEGVVISRLDQGYYKERFLGGGRPQGWPGSRQTKPQLAMQVANESTRLARTAVAQANVPKSKETLAVKPLAQELVDAGAVSAGTLPSRAQGAESATEELSNSPFARRRAPRSASEGKTAVVQDAARPKPTDRPLVEARPADKVVAAVPEAETRSELALEGWKLSLGEMVAAGRLQVEAWLKGLKEAAFG